MANYLRPLLTVIIITMLLAPAAAPAANAGEPVVYVEGENFISGEPDTASFGKIIIKETGDHNNVFTGAPQVINLTLLDGAEFAEDANFMDILDASSSVKIDSLLSSDEISVSFSLTGTANTTDKAVFDFGILNILPDFSGDIEVEVDITDILDEVYIIGGIYNEGDYEENEVSELSTEVIAVGASNVATGALRITESDVRSLHGGKITVTLPEGLKFNRSRPFKNGGLLADIVSAERIDPEDGSTNWQVNEDGNELTIYPGRLNYNAPGFLDLTFYVDVDFDTVPGEVFIAIEGDAMNNIPATSLNLATIEDLGVSVSAKSVKSIISGTWNNELDEIEIKETAPGSILPDRYIVMEIANGKFTKDRPSANKLTLVEMDDQKIVWKVGRRPQQKYTIKNLTIGTGVNASGDVTVNFSGNAGVSEVIQVALTVPPIFASAAQTATIKPGSQAQPVADIIVRETEAGAIKSGTGKELTLTCPAGACFASRPVAVVTQGDLELDNQNLVYLRDKNNDGLDDEAYVKIRDSSETASMITFSNIRLDVFGDFPEGTLDLKIEGPALYDAESAAAFDTTAAATAIVAQVVSTELKKRSGKFTTGRDTYYLNDEISIMDVAPYIAGGRMYVPLRHLAYVCGLSSRDIAWDGTTKTVTLTKNNKVVRLTIGSNMLQNDVTVTAMDAAPEIRNGRTMIPARYVAEAFGGTVIWNAAEHSVRIEFQ